MSSGNQEMKYSSIPYIVSNLKSYKINKSISQVHLKI